MLHVVGSFLLGICTLTLLFLNRELEQGTPSMTSLALIYRYSKGKYMLGRGWKISPKKSLHRNTGKQKTSWQFNFYQLIEFERLEMSELWKIFATDHNFPT